MNEVPGLSPVGKGAPGRPSSAVRAAVEVRNAADEMFRFGWAINENWPVWSWATGIAFAVTALGLRFSDQKEMAAPEFIAMLAFGAVLVLVGAFSYVFEIWIRSTGLVRMFSEGESGAHPVVRQSRSRGQGRTR